MDLISKFYLTKREKIFIILLIMALLFAISQYISSKQDDPPPFRDQVKESSNVVSNKTKTEKTNAEEIVVDVKGAVTKPGIYHLKNNARVKDVLDLAGGALPNANLNQVNLAMKLKDEMVIYVPFQGEKLENQGTNQIWGSYSISSGPSSTNGKININTADESQLMELDGIGATRAKAIIEYRQQNGPFHKIEDLMNVSGIGEKTFDKIKEKISVH
ncbi:helix-hairpin-helix domain-containing protein [Tepidibacillus sp. LV47]|uniref:helix-hairpin-helix domain-containing protein n=1 Tax=Tepidibacillus sp. LV47 TaxID=3398228 RepID=UPI003AABB7BD